MDTADWLGFFEALAREVSDMKKLEERGITGDIVHGMRASVALRRLYGHIEGGMEQLVTDFLHAEMVNIQAARSKGVPRDVGDAVRAYYRTSARDKSTNRLKTVEFGFFNRSVEVFAALSCGQIPLDTLAYLASLPHVKMALIREGNFANLHDYMKSLTAYEERDMRPPEQHFPNKAKFRPELQTAA